MSLTERRNLAYSSKLCFNCLEDGHMTRDCSSKSTCKKCQKKHNTLLHPEMVDTRKTVPFNQNTALHQSTSQFDTVVLPTAIIPVIKSDGSILKCRALLDSGAQLRMMTEDCAQRLQLKRTPASMRLNGIVSSQNISSSIGIFKIQTPCVPTFEVKALVRPNLSQFLPTHSFKVQGCFQSRSINLADPEFMESRQIDLILGSDVYEHVVLDGKLQEDNRLHLRNTIFGWVVSGKFLEQTNQVHTVTVLKTDIDLKRFWELEEVQLPQKMTEEEIQCEQHFIDTTKQAEYGRFIVKLPFKQPQRTLSDSFVQAKRRFLSLERRLTANPQLHEKYRAFIKEFMDLGHLEEIPADEVDKPSCETYYLPHHCVFKEDSTTTKLKVVFDGSAKTSNGQSLNETLMVGAKHQPDLYSTLLRFRFHKIALSGDIAKMYHQIALDKDDKDFHRILWRDNPQEPIKHLRMTRVTYGIASSSFHSIRSLQETANRLSDDSLKRAILHDFYVDDYLGGAADNDSARKLVFTLIQELKRFGFELRKWTSSDSAITLSLPDNLRETAESFKILDKEYHIKTLGVRWNPNPDTFTFKVNLDDIRTHTKRALLADISKLFDPNGWLGPIIIKYKCLLQKSGNWDLSGILYCQTKSQKSGCHHVTVSNS